MNSIFNDITQLISIIVFIVLAVQAVYLFIFALAGRIIPPLFYPRLNRLGKFVIYIPSYKEDTVIVDTARAALTIDYPVEKKHVVVIADSLKPETLDQLAQLPIQVVVVKFEKSTKAKALTKAIEQTEGDFDYAVVFDADNVAEKDFLYNMNDVLQKGYRVVQGQRVAKNTNTTFALLDAISEGINNHIFRKGHASLHLSAAIIGSGMALEYRLFKEILPELTAVGGFDKEMELRMLKRRISFGYAQNALIYDEKVTQKGHFENQRRRWLSAQFHYMQRYLADGFIELLKGNIDFFDKVFQTLLLPRILLLGLLPFAAIISLIPGAGVTFSWWLTIWIIGYVAIFMSVPAKFVNKQLLNALLHLPSAFLSMFKLFFKLKGANKTFIHTPHGETQKTNEK